GGEPIFVDTGIPGVAVDVVVVASGLVASMIAVPPETGLPPVIALIDPGSAEVVKLYNSSLDPGVLPVEADSLDDLILVAAGGGRGIVAVYSIDASPATVATEEPVTGTQGYEPPGILGSLLYSPALTVALIAALSLTIAGIIRNRRKRGTS
ncbi:MAG: hypothetical protein LRS43_00775, partial [Desulfurococcales archaeon]|nr:hypothetical protein [Desulfurococcales archaeon]